MTTTNEAQAIQSYEIVQEQSIEAPIETVFEALLEELGPEGQMPDGRSLQMKLEPWPGGRWYRDLGDNVGHF